MLLAYLTPSKDIFLIAPSPDPLKQLTCFCWYNRPQTVSRFTFVWLQSTSALTSTFTFYMAQLQLSSCQPSASATSYLPCGFLHITAAAIGQSITVSSSIKQSIARAASSPPPPLSSDYDAHPHHRGLGLVGRGLCTKQRKFAFHAIKLERRRLRHVNHVNISAIF